jgi:hypothetical protein
MNHSIYLSVYLSTAFFQTLAAFSVSSCFTLSVGPFGREISPSQGRYLHTAQHKRTQTSFPQVGFEPTIPVFERVKTVHALAWAANVIGSYVNKEA